MTFTTSVLKMFRLRRKFSCFAYISLTVFIAVLFLFVTMDKSSSSVVFDGPEVFSAYHVQQGDSDLHPASILVPKPDFKTPMLAPKPNFEAPDFPHPHLLFIPEKPNFSCAKLFTNDYNEMKRAKEYLLSRHYNFTHRDDGKFHLLTQNCDTYKRLRDFPTSPSSDLERNFPIAFNILLHKNVDQFERLLRTIYTPQNQYCIHVDKKAPPNILKSVQSIADCFDNVFVVSKLEAVVYAGYTRLQADINCMKDHVGRRTEWKYLINMASSEFPIQSNFQIVQMLTLYNGANDIHEVFSTMDAKRFKRKYVTNLDTDSGFIVKTNTLKEDPPHKLTVTKGNAYNVFSRKFVEFALQDKMATDLLKWSIDTYTPDEHYWATLNNLYSNPFLNTPGGFKGHPDKKPYFGRYIGWKNKRSRCKAGGYIHNICVFTVEDLPMISQRLEMIANKFDIDYDPVAVACMEEWVHNNTRDLTNISSKNERHYKKIAKYNEKLK